MFAAFKMFFATLTSLFSATQKLANAANEAAGWVEGEATHFNEKTTMVRLQELKQLRSQYTVEDYALAAQENEASKGIQSATKKIKQEQAAA